MTIENSWKNRKSGYTKFWTPSPQAGGNTAEDWISTGIYRFKVSQQPGKRTLNRDRLRLELVDALGDEHAAEKLISWCEDAGKPFERLTVSAVAKSISGHAYKLDKVNI